jgi:Tfp pilus assembly protein PilF
MMRPRLLPLALAAALVAPLLSGCVPPPPPVGLSDVIARPAERSLLAGMRAYDDGNYADAERALKSALAAGLASPHDQAAAHKLLAFIECTSNRIAECEASFRAARQADPGFTLSRSEAGHPVWGPVYQRVAAGH